MEYVDLSDPVAARGRQALASSTLSHIPQNVVVDEAEGPGWGETFASAFVRENIVLSAVAELDEALDRDEGPAPRAFNPYHHFLDTYGEEDRAFFDAPVRAGLIDKARSPSEVEGRLHHYRQERLSLDKIEQGSPFAGFIGGAAGATLDATTLAGILLFETGPAALAAAGGRLGAGLARAGRYFAARPALRGALLGSTSVAAQEAALHQFQDLRTAQESFLNIGVAGLLGGGLGHLARGASRARPLHPDHPDNPLNPKNLEREEETIAFRTADGDEDLIQPGGDVSARRNLDGPEAEVGVLSAIGGRAVSRLLQRATPVGRALQRQGPRTREIFTKLIDLGGIRLKDNKLGIATAQSAEAFKRDYLTLASHLFDFGEKQLRALNRQIGESGVRARLKGTIGPEEFNDVTQRLLVKSWTEADRLALGQRFGDAHADFIIQRATLYANKIHEVNGLYAKEAVRLGLMRDDAKVKRLQQELKGARSTLDRLKAERRTDNSGGTRAPVERSTPGLETEISRTREQLAGYQAQLASEMRKAPVLGEEFGHAQLYDAAAVLQRSEDFEDWLLEVLVDKPDADWLLETFNLTPEDFAGLKATEPERHAIVLREWAGDQYLHQLTRAEAREAAAARAMEEAEQDFTNTQLAHGLLRRMEGRTALSAARKKRDQVAASRIAAQAARDVESAFARALRDAAEAARTRTLERELAVEPVSRAQMYAAEKAVDAAELKLFTVISDSLKDPGTPKARLTDSGAYVKAVDDLAVAEARANHLRTKSPDHSPAAPGPRFSRAEARAKATAERLREADARLQKADERLRATDEALRKVEARHAELTAARQAIRDALTDARAAGKVVAKDLRAAKRELAKARKSAPLYEVVDTIRRSIVDRGRVPHSILDQVVVEPGRFKARRLILTPEQRRRGEEAGFLRRDLPRVLSQQYDQMAGYMGFHEAFKIGPDGAYRSAEDARRAIQEEYELLMREAPAKERPALTADLQGALQDFDGLKSRVLGTVDVGDRESWAYWLSGKARQFNMIRYGAGFGLTSLTDVGSVFLHAGPLRKMLQGHGLEMARIMRDMHADNPTAFRELLGSVELGAMSSRMSKIYDVDAALDLFGVGAPGSRTRQLTAKIDLGAARLSDATAVVSGMHYWNRAWKIMSGLYKAHRLRDMAAKYDSLPAEDVAELASLGVDKQRAGRIADFIRRHGETDANGRWDPRLELWLEESEDGYQAARDFRLAVEATMDRAIFTPGAGDTPLLMDHFGWKAFLQFQTFAYTFMNRFLVPASQRLAARDATALAAYGHLAWSGLVVVLGKDIIRGEDPTERLKDGRWEQTAFDIVDRSGMMAYLSPYVDSVLKLPMGDQSIGDLIGLDPSSRFARNNWWQSALGVQAGLVRDLGGLPGTATSGDGRKVMQKAVQLAPWNSYIRLMMSLHDGLGR